MYKRNLLGEILPREQFAKRKAAIAEAKKNKNANQPKVNSKTSQNL